VAVPHDGAAQVGPAPAGDLPVRGRR
jgi:hypothetical protein